MAGRGFRAGLWVAKALAVNALSRLPGHEHLHYWAQRALGRQRLDAPQAVGRALELFRLLAARPSTGGPAGAAGCDVLEIGTGWFPVVPLMAYLLGARSVVTVDVHPWLRLGNLRRTLDGLGRALDPVAAAPGVDGADMRARHAEAARAAASACSVAQAFGPLGIEYRCPFDVTAGGLPAAGFDVVLSSNVLEHVPPDVLRGLHRACARALRPGGCAVHRLNPGDHYVELTGSTVNFLRFGERAWRWLGGSGLAYHNRLRTCEHAAAARAAGLRVELWADAVDERALADVRSGRQRVHERFSDMGDEFLCAHYAWFVLGVGQGRDVPEPTRVRWIDDLLHPAARAADPG